MRDFSDYCYSSAENENTLAIEKRSTLQKQPLNGVLQVCVWQLLIKSFKNVCEGAKFFKKIEMIAFLVIFQGSSSQL